MKAGQELLRQISANQDAGVPTTYMAVVSPCSTCKNFREMPDETYPACPRRYWQHRADQITETPEAAETENVPADYLLRKGRADDASTYENPVAWEQGKSRILWCATLQENRAILNGDGTLKNPDILTDGFDTNFITCRTDPYIPLTREGAYYGGEQLHEGDFVLLTAVTFPQMDVNRPGDPVRIGGFASKITPMQRALITPAKKSVNPQGI